MTFDWTVVYEIGLFALLAVVVVAVVPWLKERIGADKVTMLWRWVCWAVQAAEQLFGPKKGERKKEYVLELLTSKGVEITPDVDTMVEAAVRELTDTYTINVDEETEAETAEE